MAYRFLIWLFSTPQEAEAIIGDLQEEHAGPRQCIRAIFDLAVAPFRQTPLKMAGLGLLFTVLGFPLTWISKLGAQELLLHVPVYQYIPATLFWQLVWIEPSLLGGIIIAFAMRRRHAMAVALATLGWMAVFMMVVDPALTMVLVDRPARGVMYWVSRAAFALIFWGGTTVLGTIVGLLLARPRFIDAMARRAPRATS